MIILKILLCVLLAVLCVAGAVIVLALCLPATADVSFIDGKFKYKLNYSFLKILDSDGKGFLKRIRKKKKKSVQDDLSDGYDISEEFPENEDLYTEDIDGYDNIDIDIESDIDTKIPDEPDEDNVRSEKICHIKEKKSYKPEKDSPDDSGSEQKTLVDKIDFLLDIWDIGGRPLLKVFRGFHIKNVFIDFIVANEDAYKCAINYGNICNIVYNGLAWLGEIFTLSYNTVDIQCGFSLKKSQWNASCKVSFRLYHLIIAGIWFLMTYIFKIFIPKKRKSKK